MLTAIVATDSNDLIGLGPKIPWHDPTIRSGLGDAVAKDLEFFKETTTGSIVIMGSSTYNAIGRPLPKRTNYILSKTMQSNDKITVFSNIPDLLYHLCKISAPAFVIGGGQIYNQLLPHTSVVYQTRLQLTIADDGSGVYFPKLKDSEWQTDIVRDLSHGYIRKSTRLTALH